MAEKGNTEPTKEQIDNQITNVVMRDYGTGGNYQRAAQAVTAAIQGLAGGNIAQALAGASAPYLAGVIKESTGDNIEARIMAHAVLGAVLAKSQDGSALAGAAGASIGELLATQLYPGKKASELSEVEKQKISALSTLAGGLVGGLIGGDSSSAIVAGSTAKNAVENNEVSFPLSDSFGAASASWDAYLVQQGATPEERSDAQRSLARGDGYRGPGHDFVEGLAYASGAPGLALIIPELAMGCGLAPALCSEAGIIAAEMAGGDAAVGGTALGIFGGAGAVLKGGAQEAAAANELARLSERALQVRSELNIGSGRNIAVAEYSIDGQSAELVGVSGLAKRPGTVDVPKTQVFDTIQTGNNPRTMDSEYKILSSLADKLTPSSQGVVNIYSELPVCVSCSGVISQFQQRFPGVIVKVETGKPR